MKIDFEEKYHSLEERHWWFLGRRDAILKLTKLIFRQRKDIRILEIGCSGGPLLKALLANDYLNVYGIDISKKAIQSCRSKNIKTLALMDGSNTGFREKSFDLIIASDVLEHIEDDYSAVKEWNRILKPNGYVICFVPAFRFLWSKHDEDNKHYRRYTISDLNEVFKSNNFAIIKSSYWNFVLFVPVFCLRLCLRLPFFSSKKYQLHETKEFWNKIFTKILIMENRIISKGLTLPLGVSVFTIAQKNVET